MEKNVESVITMLSMAKLIEPSMSFVELAEMHNKIMGEKTLNGVDVLTVAHTLEYASKASIKAMKLITDSMSEAAVDAIKNINSFMEN